MCDWRRYASPQKVRLSHGSNRIAHGNEHPGTDGSSHRQMAATPCIVSPKGDGTVPDDCGH